MSDLAKTLVADAVYQHQMLCLAKSSVPLAVLNDLRCESRTDMWNTGQLANVGRVDIHSFGRDRV